MAYERLGTFMRAHVDTKCKKCGKFFGGSELLIYRN